VASSQPVSGVPVLLCHPLQSSNHVYCNVQSVNLCLTLSHIIQPACVKSHLTMSVIIVSCHSVSLYQVSNHVLLCHSVSLCRASSVCRSWHELVDDPSLWRRLCSLTKWKLARSIEQKQFIQHMMPGGSINVCPLDRYCTVFKFCYIFNNSNKTTFIVPKSLVT